MAEESRWVAQLRRLLDEHWPQILLHVPATATVFEKWFNGPTSGLCTHPALVEPWWVHSRGGKRFATNETLPDSFFYLGHQDRGGSLYLFVMWFQQARRFWFYDQYAVLVAKTDASPARTAQRLDVALERWRTGIGDVTFSGPWGWFDPDRARFDKDNMHKGPEEWERVKE